MVVPWYYQQMIWRIITSKALMYVFTLFEKKMQKHIHFMILSSQNCKKFRILAHYGLTTRVKFLSSTTCENLSSKNKLIDWSIDIEKRFEEENTLFNEKIFKLGCFWGKNAAKYATMMKICRWKCPAWSWKFRVLFDHKEGKSDVRKIHHKIFSRLSSR